MNKLYPSYDTIASESMYSTPSQKNCSVSFGQPGDFINFKGDVSSHTSSAGLQEYFYIDSAFNFRWRKTE